MRVEGNPYYPVLLDLHGCSCLVVGGGPVALRKVRGLLAAGAAVRVVSPEAVPALAALAEAGRIRWERRPFRPGDAAGQAMVFACTGQADVDRQVVLEARREAAWVNAAGAPELGNVILPAVCRRGRLTVAVSTAGASPALARRVRDDLASYLDAAYAGIEHELEALAQDRERRRLTRRGAAGDPGEGM